MTLGDKLTKLRKENNYTQEQLAEILGVSRQAISKWESDAAYPETEKLLRLGELYDCSMDYLLKDGEEKRSPNEKTITFSFRNLYFERKSKKSIFGLPLWHINIGFGRTAKGVLAVGLAAKGIISIGLLSLGIVSIGLVTLGVFALGELAIGILSAGAIAAGIIAFGAISVGIVSVGALSIGYFSVGALAIGKYFAIGDTATAMIALGNTKAAGGVYQKLGELSSLDIAEIRTLLDTNIPPLLSGLKDLIVRIIKFISDNYAVIFGE